VDYTEVQAYNVTTNGIATESRWNIVECWQFIGIVQKISQVLWMETLYNVSRSSADIRSVLDFH